MDMEYTSAATIRIMGIKKHGDDRNPRCGVSIWVKEQFIHHIYQINRISNRIMEIMVKTGNSIKNISILNTYAPNMQYNGE